MNWYKLSLKLDTLSDRSILNDRIKRFKDIVVILDKMKKMVFQNAPGARDEIQKIIKDKKLTSFPHIVDILHKADDKALDNYKEFASICGEAVEKFYREIKKMEKERSDFVNKVLPSRMKMEREKQQKKRDKGKK